MAAEAIERAIGSVPAGKWAVGVSGGADSVALGYLLLNRGGLRIHLVHLDHELRGSASSGDREFVRELARKWNVPATVVRRSEIEGELGELPENPSARYRAIRIALFGRVIAEHQLDGVLLAHHADDQAETVLLRLLRGAGIAALAGMAERAVVCGVAIVRPLLGVTRAELRAYLVQDGLAWREDASNQSDDYLRNRVRKTLTAEPRESFIALGAAAASWKAWVNRVAPVLEETFACRELADLALPIARVSAARWLIARGCVEGDVSGEVAERLIEMSSDAASAPRLHFPGNVLIGRRRGRIGALAQGTEPDRAGPV